MKGRKPALAVIEGGAAPGRCPLPPAWLAEHARREWRRVAPDLHRRRLLGADTMATLESYCVAAGMVRGCQETLAAEGHYVDGKDSQKPHPAVKVLFAAMREARLLAAELGLTPHRRGKHEGDEPKADPWEGMLA
jgi:P27 family predicted phage terminase small subunit